MELLHTVPGTKVQRKGQQKAGFGGGGQNEHRYRLLQLMTFAGTGWQSTWIKRSSSLISCGMLINLIFKDIQSAIVVGSRDTQVVILSMDVYTMTQKKLTISVACFNTLQKGSDSLNNQGKCIIEN